MAKFVRSADGETVDEVLTAAPIKGVIVGDIHHPRQAFDVWPDDELAAIGYYRVNEASVPAGHKITGAATYVRNGDRFDETLSTAARTDDEKAAGRSVTAVQFYLALSAAMVAKGHTLTAAEPVRWELVKIFQALPSAVLSDAQKTTIVSVLTDANTFHRDDPNPATGTGNALDDMGALLAYVGGDPLNPEPAKAFTPAEIDALFVSILGL